MVQNYLRSRAQGWPNNTVTTITHLPASTQLPGISAGSHTCPLEPALVDKMMSRRERGIFACVSIPSVKENPGVGPKPSKRFVAVGCQDSSYSGLRSMSFFPDPPSEKPQEVPQEARVGFPVWPLETWEHVGRVCEGTLPGLYLFLKHSCLQCSGFLKEFSGFLDKHWPPLPSTCWWSASFVPLLLFSH